MSVKRCILDASRKLRLPGLPEMSLPYILRWAATQLERSDPSEVGTSQFPCGKKQIEAVTWLVIVSSTKIKSTQVKPSHHKKKQHLHFHSCTLAIAQT